MSGLRVHSVGLGYTLATGRVWCDWREFTEFAEQLLGRPIWTHEYAEDEIWKQLRQAFEKTVAEEMKT